MTMKSLNWWMMNGFCLSRIDAAVRTGFMVRTVKSGKAYYTLINR